jgi:glyoxylase-like metal-dependent hydrolase (beta-lactamase superfamily II)
MSTTHAAVSEDSGLVWTSPGAWQVSDGIWRIPLPLPMDGLRAVNVYVVETPAGLTLIDGGWAIDVSREALVAALGSRGWAVGDINAFLVTHVHRDHYTQAVALRRETGSHVTLGLPEKHSLDRLVFAGDQDDDPRLAILAEAGASDLARSWDDIRAQSRTPPDLWQYPDEWLDGDQQVHVGQRTFDALHTPGHTRGHFVFHDATDGLLFAGDHVLPTITPSIGFETEPAPQPLGDFMASLTKVRGLPDSKLLPAHGPVAPSVHSRVDQLLAHHEDRLDQCQRLLDPSGVTALDVATALGWTGRGRPFSALDVPNKVLATLETRAHLELLVAQGRAARQPSDGTMTYTLRLQPGSTDDRRLSGWLSVP